MSITTILLIVFVIFLIITGKMTYEEAMMALILIQLMSIENTLDKYNE